MMYRIVGRIAKGFAWQEVHVDAPNEAEARAKATQLGIISIEQISDLSPKVVPNQRGGCGDLFLTIGQLISVFGCVGALVSGFIGFLGVWGGQSLLVAGSVVGFCYSAAMLVVFSRVKRLPPVGSL